eukprot:TRINITY_DN1230_c0_g1_i5.p1 TRINITY_DN1230_c0_g1~~TRINITY_DN1230_c0_g1_i5.p1  ORF type:complete len:406 (-),score=105.11 TRINITY_DN1230_c0_g1_i5:191-1408(-)
MEKAQQILEIQQSLTREIHLLEPHRKLQSTGVLLYVQSQTLSTPIKFFLFSDSLLFTQTAAVSTETRPLEDPILYSQLHFLDVKPLPDHEGRIVVTWKQVEPQHQYVFECESGAAREGWLRDLQWVREQLAANAGTFDLGLAKEMKKISKEGDEGRSSREIEARARDSMEREAMRCELQQLYEIPGGPQALHPDSRTRRKSRIAEARAVVAEPRYMWMVDKSYDAPPRPVTVLVALILVVDFLVTLMPLFMKWYVHGGEIMNIFYVLAKPNPTLFDEVFMLSWALELASSTMLLPCSCFALWLALWKRRGARCRFKALVLCFTLFSLATAAAATTIFALVLPWAFQKTTGECAEFMGKTGCKPEIGWYASLIPPCGDLLAVLLSLCIPTKRSQPLSEEVQPLISH